MKQYRGVTLLEMLLVLLLGASILTLGIQQFKQYQRDNEVRQIRSAVDKLFQALSAYYQANCRSSAAPPLPAVLSISTLVSDGYLTEWRPIYTSISDYTAADSGLTATDYGFYVAFNTITADTTSHAPAAVFNTWLGPTPMTATPLYVALPSSPTPVATVYQWQAHVAMKLNTNIITDPALYPVYQARLSATCTADLPTTSCTPTPTAGPYMIWESLPTVSSGSNMTTSNMYMPNIKAFTNLYYTDDMYSSGNPPTPESGMSAGNYYQCGG